MSAGERACPGCGLRLPVSDRAFYDGYFNTSPECWSLYTEALEVEFSHAVVFGQVHQLSVDAYAVQHAGGSHPDKSVAVHLCGLHLMLEKGHGPPEVPRMLQRIAATAPEWPHFPPPAERGRLTVGDVTLAGSPQEHIDAVRAWAEDVWRAWSSHHEAVARFAAERLAAG